MGERTSGSRPTAYWLIAKREIGWAEVLTIEVGGEETLAVFSFEEEARLFLLFEGLGANWRVRKTAAGMVRTLLGPRARARRVVLDPLPEILDEETNLLVSLGREEFARRLYAERSAGSSGRRCLGGAAFAREARGRRGR